MAVPPEPPSGPPAPASPGAPARSARRDERRRRRVRIAAAVAGSALVVAAAATGTALLLADGDTPAAAPTRAPVTASSTSTTALLTQPTTPPRPCRAPLTPDAPLRLWIAGDSIAHTVGTGLGARVAATGVVAPVYESRVSSGLANPAFFDWPRRAGTELARLDPEVVVFVMGTNDWAVPPSGSGNAGAPTGATWRTDYADRVRSLVATLAAEGRTLYWVGPPVLRDRSQEAGAREVSAVIAEVVAEHPDAEFVDAHDLLDDGDGGYTAHAVVAGRSTQVRTDDGVHFTEAGARFLGDALFAVLDHQCALADQAVPGVRQPVVETRGSTSVPPTTSAAPGGPAPTEPAPPPTSMPVEDPSPVPTTLPEATPDDPPDGGPDEGATDKPD